MLATLLFAGWRSFQAGLPALEVTASGLGLLLLPCALIACLRLSKKESQGALRLILLLGALQVPLLVANHFGYLTSRPGIDQYEGLYFARGAYLSTYTVGIALLVFLVIVKNVWASATIVVVISLLAYFTENKLLFSLMGVSIGGYLATSVWKRRRPHVLVVKTLAAAVAFMIPTSVGVILSFEAPAVGWRAPLSGSSLTQAERAISRISDEVVGDSTDSVDSLNGVVAAAVAPQGAFYEGSVANFLLGRGLGLGTSHHAIEGTARADGSAREPLSSAIVTSNPSSSIAIGPGATMFAWLSEAGFLGLLMILFVFFRTVKRLMADGDPRYVSSILAPAFLLFATTPVLESPALPALLALSLMATAGASDISLRRFALRRAWLANHSQVT